MADSLKSRALQLLAAAALPSAEVIHEVTHAEQPGDAQVTLKVGPMHLRFLRERGQDFVDVGPADVPARYFQFGDIEVAMGWSAADQVWARLEPEPLTDILELLRDHYAELAEAFSDGKVSETLMRLDSVSRRRGADFAERLRRVAEAASRKP